MTSPQQVRQPTKSICNDDFLGVGDYVVGPGLGVQVKRLAWAIHVNMTHPPIRLFSQVADGVAQTGHVITCAGEQGSIGSRVFSSGKAEPCPFPALSL